MRDVLIHAYEDVDLNEIWKTVSEDIPDLLSKIDPLLPTRKDIEESRKWTGKSKEEEE